MRSHSKVQKLISKVSLLMMCSFRRKASRECENDFIVSEIFFISSRRFFIFGGEKPKHDGLNNTHTISVTAADLNGIVSFFTVSSLSSQPKSATALWHCGVKSHFSLKCRLVHSVHQSAEGNGISLNRNRFSSRLWIINYLACSTYLHFVHSFAISKR